MLLREISEKPAKAKKTKKRENNDRNNKCKMRLNAFCLHAASIISGCS